MDRILEALASLEKRAKKLDNSVLTVSIIVYSDESGKVMVEGVKRGYYESVLFTFNTLSEAIEYINKHNGSMV